MSVKESATRRITRRLMPYLMILYLVSFLDRTNLAVAVLGMKSDLGFTETVVGAGAGIFFLGYFLLEIPGTLLVERWSARKWIGRIMITWGIVAAAMGFIGLPFLSAIGVKTQFFGLRFLLGLAEAGFFPGVVVYLSHWFRYEQRAQAKSLFMISIPAASVVSVPLSQLILHQVGWMGLAGWRWVFILEGLPAVILGVVTIYYLTDRPEEAKWLPEDEKRWLTDELARERDARHASSSSALLNPRVFLLVVIYFFSAAGLYGLTFFLPSVTAAMKGTSVLTQTVFTTLPYVCGCLAILYNGRHSDRTGERRWHTAVPLLVASAAMALTIVCTGNLALTLVFLCILGAGLHAHYPVFWTHPGSRLTGTAAAVAVGLINSVGNLGGFFGPKYVGQITTQTGSFRAAMWLLSGCLLIAGILASFLRPQRD